MKIFKLKYIVVVLIAGLLGSCTSTDNLPEAAENAAIENGDFVMDLNMHYLVDGLVTSDKDLIKNSINNAWNVHFDDSKGKVVISTNPAEFEKYKNANQEFKNALEVNESNARIENKSVVQRVAAIPTGGPATVVAGFTDQSVIIISHAYPSSFYYIQFHATSDTDLTTRAVYEMQFRSDGTLRSDFTYQPYKYVSLIFSNSTYTDVRAVLNNESGTSTLTKTFYRNINFTGASQSYTVPRHGYSNIGYLLSLDPLSYR